MSLYRMTSHPDDASPRDELHAVWRFLDDSVRMSGLDRTARDDEPSGGSRGLVYLRATCTVITGYRRIETDGYV